MKIVHVKRACFISVLCLAAALGSPAQTFTTLQSFDGTDGEDPNGLVQGADGNFYGQQVLAGPLAPVLLVTTVPDVARSLRLPPQVC